MSAVVEFVSGIFGGGQQIPGQAAPVRPNRENIKTVDNPNANRDRAAAIGGGDQSLQLDPLGRQGQGGMGGGGRTTLLGR